MLLQRYLELSREPKAVEIIVTSGQTARVPFNIPKVHFIFVDLYFEAITLSYVSFPGV